LILMDRLIRFADRFSTWAAWVGGGILFATAVLIAVEVTLRKVFSVSMGGADELSSYALAISCSWTFGYALFRKAHIRIDVLYMHLPRPVQFALDIASLALFAVYMLMLSYFAFFVLGISIQRHSVANTPLATPLWIPQSLWYAGIVGFTLTVLILLAGTLYHLLRGDLQSAARLSGASTIEEEIEDGRPPEKKAPERGGAR
jgi:TRAP-type C4-dicarboxylate transport system permease small subunit